jgi:hypothetical protein
MPTDCCKHSFDLVASLIDLHLLFTAESIEETCAWFFFHIHEPLAIVHLFSLFLVSYIYFFTVCNVNVIKITRMLLLFSVLHSVTFTSPD